MTIPIIQFNFLAKIGLADRQRLKQFLARRFRQEGRDLAELQYIFCSDAYLLAINRQWLEHDYFTDIITFQLSAKREPILAEIYISVDRVRENAVQYGGSMKRELHRVMFHGALHLCGYTDKTAARKAEIRAKEEEYLQKYFRGV
jgi:rRNA maturation RNase YbeY